MQRCTATVKIIPVPRSGRMAKAEKVRTFLTINSRSMDLFMT